MADGLRGMRLASGRTGDGRGKEVFEQNSKELEDKIDEIYRYLYENNIKE